MSESFPQPQPSAGETDGGQELPATILADAIKARLEEAVQTGEQKTDSIDGKPYLNLQEAGDPDAPPADVYRILEAGWAARSDRHDSQVVVIDHLESEQPALKIGDLNIGEEKREEMAGQGFAMGDEDEVIEWKREYDITTSKNFNEPNVREVREVVASNVQPKPENHEGAWGWAQIVRNMMPADSPELAEIAEKVQTLPIKHEVVSRGPVIPRLEAGVQPPGAI